MHQIYFIKSSQRLSLIEYFVIWLQAGFLEGMARVIPGTEISTTYIVKFSDRPEVINEICVPFGRLGRY